MENDSKLSMKKKNGNYVFTSKVNYKNNPSLTHQEVVVDKNLDIKQVTVYDEEENVGIKVVFKQIDMKAKFKDNYFVLEENMEAWQSANENETITSSKEVTNVLDEAVYPMYLPEGTYLETEKTVDIDNGSRKILTFAGDTPFMLVEEPAVKEDELSVIPTSGDLDIFRDSVAVISDTSVNFVSDGVEYYLVSSEMEVSELVNVAKSISVMPVSK